MGGTTFGIGSPFAYPSSLLNPFTQMSQQNPFAGSPFGTPTFGASPYWGQQQYGGQQQHYAHQLQQILQILPQELQHLQQLEYVQQQLNQQVQQVLQAIPQQLQQLQQLIQFAPQQFQQGQPQPQAQQPFGQAPSFGGFSAQTPQWGGSPQLFGQQPSHVM